MICPVCSEEVEFGGDATPNAAPRKRPHVGDVIICMGCGVVSIFDREMRPRLLLETQLVLLPKKSQEVIAQVRRRILQ